MAETLVVVWATVVRIWNAHTQIVLPLPTSVHPIQQALFDKARAGDPAAFQTLVGPHADAVRRFAFGFVKDWTEADDLAQEALVKAFRSFAAFEGRSSLSTWLFAVTRSVCLDSFKKRETKERQRAAALDESIPATLESTEELLVGKQGAEALWGALKRLKAEYRVPVILFDIEGMSYQDIAEVEGVPVGTIRSRLSRGRSQLARVLAPAGIKPARVGTIGFGSASVPLGTPAK